MKFMAFTCEKCCNLNLWKISDVFESSAHFHLSGEVRAAKFSPDGSIVLTGELRAERIQKSEKTH